MNCSEFKNMLDLYIDGELDDRTKAAFLAHADACVECSAELNAAEQLRDFLSHMDEDVAVPLPAQAAWRGAVRAEARRRRMKRVYAACGAVAAACVLTLGVSTMLRTGTQTPAADAAIPRSVALVETDGISDDAALDGTTAMLSTGTSDPVAYINRTIRAEDIQTSYGYLMDIVAEYDGVVEGETAENANMRVVVLVPGENAADFISAVDHIGVDVEEENAVFDAAAEFVGVCVVIAEN